MSLSYAVDFETYYDSKYSVKGAGRSVFTYVADPRFDPYLVSIVGPGVSYVGPVASAPWSQIHGAEYWVSHNATFDRNVYRRAAELGLVGKTADGQVPCPKVWQCTADLVSYFQQTRNLKSAAHAMLGQSHSKEQRDSMLGKKWHELTPELKAALSEYALKDSELCLQLWEKYRGQWPAREQRVADLTRGQGLRGIRVDERKLDQALEAARQETHAIATSVPWAEEVRSRAEKELDDDSAETPPPAPSVMSRNALAAECKARGLPVPKSTNVKDERWIKWWTENGPKADFIQAVQRYRKLIRVIRSLEVVKGRLTHSHGDAFFPFALKYFGAEVTGRWSGSEAFNMQNLSKEVVNGASIREMFIPRAGCKFVIADFAQIEPRCLAFLARDYAFLDTLRSGMDLYEAHARLTMGYTDPRPLAEVDKALRRIAKIRVLGLGYGAGPNALLTVAKTLAGIDLSPEEAEATVKAYRESNPAITNLWNSLDRYLKSVVYSGGDRKFSAKIPSGRILRYFDCSVDELLGGGFVGRKTMEGQFHKIYGPRLVENLTQALARDVLVHSIDKLTMAGYPPLWHVHDEVIIEVPIADAEAHRTRIAEIMSEPPEWLNGRTPIAVEAKLHDYYTK